MQPSPREMASMYSQADLVLELLNDSAARTDLKGIFKEVIE
ncbi:MAG: hypothetical protein ACREX3_24310 [Gammaproteobacteria bacterium]